ncbi:unnamed protein product [Pleuronectes platessa]|uniref:Uncharacterized protein n=1 Tax=Pleuronectes platessa TaxID=8262 RepID=A0A9N7VXI4_PLEPL|nr:unnamed protein product [Pleuronectes platessa]
MFTTGATPQEAVDLQSSGFVDSRVGSGSDMGRSHDPHPPTPTPSALLPPHIPFDLTTTTQCFNYPFPLLHPPPPRPLLLSTIFVLMRPGHSPVTLEQLYCTVTKD